MSSTAVPKVVPAQLSFLAIYNPSLASSEETFDEQIVFYYSKATKATKVTKARSKADQGLREHENEKLRQVGLAQGMLGFAKSFSNGEPVDSVETHKSRIVLHELEHAWWILASIDLTQLPTATNASRKEPAVDYSSREVSPPGLLIQQLIRAHSIFLLHHGLTLAAMFATHGRPKFCAILDKYWSKYASSWDVLLHASPAVDMYRAIKLAAGGELGMGVGEEEWGSSERDVLEDFARRTNGLVDVIVSRFGMASPLQQAKASTDPKTLHVSENEPWMGSGRNIHAADGVVFSGLGAISRKSLRDVSHWIESIYCHGENAYCVRDHPTADRRKRRRRKGIEQSIVKPAPKSLSGSPPRVPRPIVNTVESSLDIATAAVQGANKRPEDSESAASKPMLGSLGDGDMWMKYMTLGYGSSWGGKKSEEPQQVGQKSSAGQSPEPEPEPEPMRYVEPAPDVDTGEERRILQMQQENDGYFLVGLRGDMKDVDNGDDNNQEDDLNNHIALRTVHVEIRHKADTFSLPLVNSDDTRQVEREAKLKFTATYKLSEARVVVYVHQPFIYTFLFDVQTEALSTASFYRDTHQFFSPLHRSLDKSTSPDRVATRLAAAANPYTTTSSTKGSESNTQPIYNLVFNPRTLTVHSSLPNIPDPDVLIAEGLSSTSSNALGWSRAEALNVHSQIIATVASTRSNLTEIERTCKTSRGWWVVWMRLPPSLGGEDEHQGEEPDTSHAQCLRDELGEAFLVRRARDAPAPTAKSTGSRFASGMWSSIGMGGGGQSQRMGGAAAGWGPKGLADGIGIDARRYVEDLLSLNR